MDRERFDALARLLATTGSRRSTLGGAIGVALLGVSPDALARPGKRKGKGHTKRRQTGKGKDKGKNQRRNRDGKVRAQALPAKCCASGACTPGPGKNLGKCCYEGQILANRNFKGANLGSATFRGATLTNANLSGANLDKTCFVDANLTEVKWGGANIGTAIFCRTIMPDGITNNGGCTKGTTCCPTCDDQHLCEAGHVCCNGRCRAGNCCINGQATTCAAGETCCADGCENTETDVDNCGTCGNACAAGADCIGGECERILSGGPDPADEIFVDDDLTVRLNAQIIFQENDGVATEVPPIVFLAQGGDQLRVVATDALQFCHQLSPLFLHSAAGESSQLSTGVPQTCPGVAVGVFFDETFTIPA